ncbi:MAG: ChbG/HpnK family deacetylase [Actinobacteria bacterium]|nr:MAG: ChbG/HpnK family deacetylase [Actinomycetota bacterium]
MTVVAARLLIVNADDYGLTPGVSRGILRGVREGVVTSTSVLVLGSGFSRSVGWLRDEAPLGVGVHLALVGEDPPLSAARDIPTLIDRRGRLPRSWRQLVPKVMAKRIDFADVERELAAQIGAAQDAGLSIDHLNSHQHVHMFPGLREVVVDLAHRFDVPAIRVTRSTTRGPVGLLIRRLAATLERELQADGIVFPRGAAGLDEAGRFDESAMLRALDRFASSDASSVELSGHPGEAEDDERSRYRWGYHWGAELDAVLSPRVRQAIERHGYRLGSYRDLAATRL